MCWPLRCPLSAKSWRFIIFPLFFSTRMPSSSSFPLHTEACNDAEALGWGDVTSLTFLSLAPAFEMFVQIIFTFSSLRQVCSCVYSCENHSKRNQKHAINSRTFFTSRQMCCTRYVTALCQNVALPVSFFALRISLDLTWSAIAAHLGRWRSASGADGVTFEIQSVAPMSTVYIYIFPFHRHCWILSVLFIIFIFLLLVCAPSSYLFFAISQQTGRMNAVRQQTFSSGNISWGSLVAHCDSVYIKLKHKHAHRTHAGDLPPSRSTITKSTWTVSGGGGERRGAERPKCCVIFLFHPFGCYLMLFFFMYIGISTGAVCFSN